MNEKTIEVSGLSFTQVDIFGCYLPSHASIESVLEKITYKRKKQAFRTYFNLVVTKVCQQFDIPIYLLDRDNYEASLKNLDRDNMSIADLSKILLIITKLKCELSGYSFNRVNQSNFTILWFTASLGKPGFDVQKSRKDTKTILRVYRGLNKVDCLEKYLNQEPKFLVLSITNTVEIIAAKIYNNMFNHRVYEISLHDRKMLDLMMADIEITNKQMEILEKMEKVPFLDLCQKCFTTFTNKQERHLRICGSCQKKSQEQKKVSRRIDRGGWVSVGTGKCGGGCGSLKIKINTLSSCLKCYDSNS